MAPNLRARQGSRVGGRRIENFRGKKFYGKLGAAGATRLN
jgi:hypothetical protein